LWVEKDLNGSALRYFLGEDRKDWKKNDYLGCKTGNGSFCITRCRSPPIPDFATKNLEF